MEPAEPPAATVHVKRASDKKGEPADVETADAPAQAISGQHGAPKELSYRQLFR